jgi:A/G-specific adenine glycosylase
VSSKIHNDFREQLMLWHKCHNKRSLPWKEEKSAYRIWVSEIILQQTRAEQGILYYNRFLSKFSNINELASASLEDVYRIWEGLGYYSRARNMHETAKEIVKSHNGIFPSSYETILSLKGIGPYTAAAISSFAFQLPFAVVDGNVYRVLSRFFGIDKATDSSEGKKTFALLADECLDVSSPHIYNQAIMDFGATVCKPENPQCNVCPFIKKCIAFKKNRIDELPVKTQKKKIKTRYFLFLLYLKNGQVAIEKRVGNDIWRNLFQFPLLEISDAYMFENPLKAVGKNLIPQKNLMQVTAAVKQQLTHRLVYGKALVYKATGKVPDSKQLLWVSPDELKNYPLPRLLHLLIDGELKSVMDQERNA